MPPEVTRQAAVENEILIECTLALLFAGERAVKTSLTTHNKVFDDLEAIEYRAEKKSDRQGYPFAKDR